MSKILVIDDERPIRSTLKEILEFEKFQVDDAEDGKAGLELIKKNIGKKIILIDRFSDSTIAYQHYGMGVNLKFIQNINDHLLKNIKIDFTFLNTVNLSNMKKRLRLRKKLNRYDKFNSKFYEKVQNGFIKILKKNPKKYIKINSNLDIDLNENIILNKINDLI